MTTEGGSLFDHAPDCGCHKCQPYDEWLSRAKGLGLRPAKPSPVWPFVVLSLIGLAVCVIAGIGLAIALGGTS